MAKNHILPVKMLTTLNFQFTAVKIKAIHDEHMCHNVLHS